MTQYPNGDLPPLGKRQRVCRVEGYSQPGAVNSAEYLVEFRAGMWPSSIAKRTLPSANSPTTARRLFEISVRVGIFPSGRSGVVFRSITPIVWQIVFDSAGGPGQSLPFPFPGRIFPEFACFRARVQMRPQNATMPPRQTLTTAFPPWGFRTSCKPPGWWKRARSFQRSSRNPGT